MSLATSHICDRLLSIARNKGAEAKVFVREGNAGHVRFAAGEITTSGTVSTTEARLTLAFGRRHATAQTNQTDDHSLEELFARCEALAKVAPEDPEYMPPVAARSFPQNHAADDPETGDLPPGRRAESARAALTLADAKGLVASGFIESHRDATTLATSSGLRAAHEQTTALMTTTMRTKDGSGSGWAGAEVTRVRDLDAPELARVAADKAERSRAPTRLDPGRYTVVLEPAAVASLLGFLMEALDARAADQGRSYFSHPPSDIDPRALVRSDPFDPAMPSCPWDEDGIALRPTTWIEGGQVRALQTTRFWAKKTGKEPTGSHDTFQLSCGPSAASSPSAVLAGVQRGLLVTRFWYTRWLEPKRLLITGLTRDGVWLIENGKITRPVNNFRFNASPMTMLTRMVDMTAATYRVPWWGNIVRVPVVCCNDFEMASVSDAV